MSGSPSAICAKARFLHLSEASKFSFFIAQVPSCPEHSSTTLTFEQVAGLIADVLHAQVAWHVVIDVARAGFEFFI